MRPVGKSALQHTSSVRATLVQVLCFVGILIFSASSLYGIDLDRVNSIRSSVFALDSARQAAIREFEEATLPAREVADYKDFVAYLNTRITNYCQELAGADDPVALEGLPCPKGSGRAATGATAAPSGGAVFYTTGSGETAVRTQAEKSAELEGNFLTTLGEFDEMLLKEEDKLSARVPSQRETAGASSSGLSGSGDEGAGTGSGEFGEEGEQLDGGGNEALAEGQEGRPEAESGPQGSAGAESAEVDHSVYGAPGGKLPPPEDDDIVARQLREAAEKEPDPELKKKLWEEYWKYKGVSK